ncbi:MAG TPA: thioredoxin domain-containing protein [bacterium]
MPNRLSQEGSPYLRQHAENPVDWYPWGDEAFARARSESRPILLSIGYSTCHWCHVMAHESFERAAIAAQMNRDFICVKVDREEHPDVDQIYMNAVMAMTGQGGWPLTVFLTPEGRPFFGGTYFPPERRWNMPGFGEVLAGVSQAWAGRRGELERSADQLTRALASSLAGEEGAAPYPDASVLERAYEDARASFDAERGGFGGAPKFPRAHLLSFLLAYADRAREPEAARMATATLDHLMRGGIHDHVGGGYHRYATDADWRVPHFEKMLYDQALLARAAIEAWQATGEERYAAMARDIVAYVLRDLRAPDGGFAAAEDADSEGREGAFYVWTPAGIRAVLGDAEGERIARIFGVSPEGTVEGGASVLHLARPLDELAAGEGLAPDALRRSVGAASDALRRAREARPRPHRDEKVLTSWNGLMIGSLAYGAAALREPTWLAEARAAAGFLRARLTRDGRLLRRYVAGEARYPGTLEDYAALAAGLLDLYEAGFEPGDLAWAVELLDAMREECWDEAHGGFFMRSRSQEPLIARMKDVYDGATPSGNSMAARVLLRAARLTGRDDFESLGRRTLEVSASAVSRHPSGSPVWLLALDEALGPVREVVVAGSPDDPRTAALLEVIRARLRPRTVTLLRPPDSDARAPLVLRLAPYAAAHAPIEGAPAAFVCERRVCREPTTDPSELARWLNGEGAGRRPAHD